MIENIIYKYLIHEYYSTPVYLYNIYEFLNWCVHKYVIMIFNNEIKLILTLKTSESRRKEYVDGNKIIWNALNILFKASMLTNHSRIYFDVRSG